MPKEPISPEQPPQLDDVVLEINPNKVAESTTAEDTIDEQRSQFVRLGRIGAFGPSLDGDFYEI